MPSRHADIREPRPAPAGGRRPLLPLILALLSLAVWPPVPALADAYGQLLQMGGGGVSIPEANPPKCISNCGDDTRQEEGRDDEEHRGGIVNLIEQWQAKAAARAEARKQEGHNQNEQGVSAYQRGDYREALRLFRQAARNDPDNATIGKNLKNAEAALARLEQEQLNRKQRQREEAEFRRQTAPFTALMPTVATLPPAHRETTPATGTQPPNPGFAAAQWQEYLAAQATVNRLYAKLNADGALADADAQTFYAALQTRNRLWAAAVYQPLNQAQRDRSPLPLPVAIDKNLLALPALLKQLRPQDPAGAEPPTPERAPDRRDTNAVGISAPGADAITASFVADYAADKGASLFAGKVGETIAASHGEALAGRYEQLLQLAQVAVKAREGLPQAGAATVDLVLSRMPAPLSGRASSALDGGRLYSSVAYRALNRFMVEAMQATGADFDAAAFWQRFDADLNARQKGVTAWIQFGE